MATKREAAVEAVEEFTNEADVRNDTFDRTGRVHDWRNHVPETIKVHWRYFNHNERRMAIAVAMKAADSEEWD